MVKKPYASMNVNGEEYKLKISSSAAMDAEKKRGKGLLEAAGDLRSVTTQIILLWASLQMYQHGMSMNTAADLYDAYMDTEDGCLENLINILVEVMEVSGFTKAAKPAKKSGETATQKK